MAEHPARRMLGERPLPSDPTTAVVTPPPPGSDYGTSGKADAVGRPRIASPTEDSLPPGPLRETRPPACLLGARQDSGLVLASLCPAGAAGNGDGAATAGISGPNFRESGLARTAN